MQIRSNAYPNVFDLHAETYLSSVQKDGLFDFDALVYRANTLLNVQLLRDTENQKVLALALQVTGRKTYAGRRLR